MTRNLVAASALVIALALLFASRAQAVTLTLTWTDNSGGAAVTLLERSSAGARYTQVAQVAPGVTTYADGPSLRHRRLYCYRTQAMVGVARSAYSNVACATTR